jgi:hypothetical protein
MSSLMDRINRGMAAKPSTTPTASQQSIKDVLKAKSGKASTGSGPQESSLLQQTAQQQAQDNLRQIDMSGAIAAQGLEAGFEQQAQQKQFGQEKIAAQGRMARSNIQAAEQQEAAQREAREQLARTQRTAEENIRMDVIQTTATNNLRKLSNDRQIQFDNIFGEFTRDKKQLADRQDAAELHQLGFEMAMSDRAYTDEINRIGSENRLMNEMNFREESSRIILGNDIDILRDDQEWGRAFNADRRTWEKEIAKISLNSAAQIARAEIKANNTRMQWEAYGNAASTVVDEYAKSDSKDEFEPIPQEGPVRQ